MVRLLVLLLLLANGVYFAWSQGHLRSFGWSPAQQAEPQRLTQQIRPEAVRVLAGDEARRIETSAPAAAKPSECLQAGLLDEAQSALLRPVLETFPPGSWSLEVGTEPARWIVYMGKYPSADSVARKKAELRQLGISFESLTNPTLEPGLSLGGFADQNSANDQLTRLSRSGVRTARVVQERPEMRGQWLRLPAVDDGLRPRLDELKAGLNGKSLRGCR